MTTQHVHINVGGKTREERAEIEAKRGIYRDNLGKIIRTEEWKRARIQSLQEKKIMCLQRLENINSELISLGVLLDDTPQAAGEEKSLWTRFVELVKEIFN